MTRLMLLAVGVSVLGGCALERASQNYTKARIDEAIARYKAAATRVKLGDARDKVLEILGPTQFELESNEIRPPEAIPTMTESGADSMVVVHFFRSARHDYDRPDRLGLPPEDDFTPYIFTDEVLTGVGWTSLATLKLKKRDDPVPAHRQEPACKQLGPLAGCF